jgi:hypothetical protein
MEFYIAAFNGWLDSADGLDQYLSTLALKN